MLEMRPATADDVRSLGKTIPKTSWAFAVTDQDKVVAVAGYYLHEGKAVMFASIDHPTARAGSKFYPRDVLKFARAVLAASIRAGVPIAAHADPEIPGSDTLLEHMGMQPIEKEIYLWPGYR